MKKIILFILRVIVLYILMIFSLPNLASSIWEKLWLLWFNNKVIKIKQNIDDFFTWVDINESLKETKNSALEIKQNIDNNIKETQDKIDTIRENVDKTIKAIDDTKKTINETIKTTKELQESIVDIIPTNTSTWN